METGELSPSVYLMRGRHGGVYTHRHRLKAQHLNFKDHHHRKRRLLYQSDTQDFEDFEGVIVAPPPSSSSSSELLLLLSFEEVSSEVRMRYVMGVQLMIQSNCEVLVQTFGVSPLICGLAATIWLRFVASTRVFDPQWADKTFQDSELPKNKGGPEKCVSEYRNSKGIININGQSAAVVLFRSLRKSIPLSYSLAVPFLACHVSREPILPTDIYNWALEGKLPYLTAFIDIEKRFAGLSTACPLSSRIMFKPLEVVGSREIEFQSGFIAQSIGLQLPPVNFFAIARRYLNKLALPLEKFLQHVARIYEWSTPPDLWLSSNPNTLPSRVCVMSIILVTLRILYNIHGFGIWEKSICSIPEKTKTRRKTKKRKTGSDVSYKWPESAELLRNLEAIYKKNDDTHEYLKDLPTYLDYCKNVIFAGLDSLLKGDEEERIIDKLWKFYKHSEDTDEKGSTKERFVSDDLMNEDEVRDECHTCSTSASKGISSQDEHSASSKEKLLKLQEDRALKRMKLNMEENGFCYIPPRVKVKRSDYLHYVRKNDEGNRTNVAHADYYILLRACAQVAQVSVQDMHAGALKFEKRLSHIEELIDQSLHYLTSQNPSPQSKQKS